MTLALPTHLVDTVTAATSTGVEAASQLLHDVGQAVSSVADTTSSRARKFARQHHLPHQQQRASHRNWVLLVVVGGAIAVAAVVIRWRLGRSDEPGTLDDLVGSATPENTKPGTAGEPERTDQNSALRSSKAKPQPVTDQKTADSVVVGGNGRPVEK